MYGRLSASFEKPENSEFSVLKNLRSQNFLENDRWRYLFAPVSVF